MARRGLRFLVVGLTAALPLVAFAQSNSKEIMKREAAALIALLGKEDAPLFEKAKACQRLAVIGTPDAIPALAALLGDEKLNLYARTGLEGIPGPAANATFRDALAKLQGRSLIGVINSIGQRRDSEARPQLSKLLADKDPAVVAAAARALGRLGGAESAEILQNTLAHAGTDKTAIADACLVCADELIAAGKSDAAKSLYAAVAKQDLPKYLQVAVRRGQLRLLGAQAKDLLIEQIRSTDEEFFNLGLAAARDVPGPEMTAALAAEVERLPPQRQALLITALGERKDRPAISLLQNAITNSAVPVRIAALNVLAKYGGPEAVRPLLDAALTEGDVAKLARDRLKNLPGKDADSAIVARLRGAEPEHQVALIELIGARRIVSATPAVRAAAEDANEPVRLAAITALGQLVSLNDLELLSKRALQANSSAETTAAQAALTAAALRMPDREACAGKLASLLSGTSTMNQVFLLELLTKLSGPKALDAVVAKASDSQLKEAATRLLGEWPDAEAAPALLELAKTEKDPKYKVRAMRGYIRIARQLQLTDEARTAMFRTAMEVASRDEEKQLALDILTRIPSAATLDLAVSYLRDPTLTNAAADAAIKIAPKIINSDPKAVLAAMQKVVDAGVGGNLKSKATQLLAQAKGTG